MLYPKEDKQSRVLLYAVSDYNDECLICPSVCLHGPLSLGVPECRAKIHSLIKYCSKLVMVNFLILHIHV